jgi:signal transduction histidine kinase
VDDDPLALTAASLLLDRQGYSTRGFTDPRKLIAVLGQEAKPQLILADLYMPEMNGNDLVQRVHELAPDVAVTIMTSARDLDGTVNAINRGAFGFLLKPIVPEQLEWLISRLLREQVLKEGIEAEKARLAHAQRLASLGTLTSGIAHEINNPNCFVLGNIDLLEKLWERLEAELDSMAAAGNTAAAFARREMPGILRELRSGAIRIANIVRSLSIYARRERDGFSRTSVRQAVEDAALVLRNKLSVLKFLVEDESEGRAYADVNATDVEQMVVNLISNAADAAQHFAHPAVTVRISVPSEREVRVDVTDNGPGIGADQVHLLETPFYTTKEPGAGTGLGLHITRQLVSRAGGTLGFRNNAGPGATFTLILPAVTKLPDSGEPHARAHEGVGRG